MQVCKSLYINIKKLIIAIILLIVLPFSASTQTIVKTDSTTLNSIKPDSLVNNGLDSINLNIAKKQKPNQIDAEINYTANDSIVFFGNGTGFLHGNSEMKYKNINLKADFVRVSMDSSLVFARGNTDSIGAKIGEPVFSEGDKSYNSRELTYNLKSKKGYIRQAVTQEGEGYIISDKTKKTIDDVFCMSGGKYTTCENHDHPDFYLSMSKGKVKPGEYIVTGPAHLVIADVPLPIAIPFGFFPFTSEYSSGVLMPSYSDELTRGFGLTNGGYYFAINDYVDIEMRGDVYTKGTWAGRLNSTYTKRYKFRGSLGLEYREDVTGEKDLANYNKSKNLRISWSHSQDQKANPNFTFSSSVNFSTSGYNRSNINNYARPEITSQNVTSSSINFTKRFPELPSLSLSGGMSLSQRNSDSTISVGLPNLNISYSRFYPFKRKVSIGNEKWYEKISMSYSGTLANSITTKENLLLTSNLQKDWKNGMRHSIPVSATFNILKYINISPSFNYTERWYLQSENKSWDSENNVVHTDTAYKFNRVYDFNMGVSASTKLYGFYIPSRAIFGDKIDRIRHVITPSVGFSYTPDFGEAKWGYYDTYEKTVNGVSSEVQYSHYANSLYGTPGTGKNGSINFSIGNNVEMKVRNDKDTTETNKFKKISLIDNLTLGSSYNMAVDSMNWSNISASLRLKLTKSYSLSLSTSFDPYMFGLNSSGSPVRINKLRWANGGFPRFQGTSTSYSYTLSNETFKKLFGKKTENKDGDAPADQTPPEANSQNGLDNIGDSQIPNKSDDGAAIEKELDGYQKTSIPWSVSLSYMVTYGKTGEFDYDKMEYKLDFTHNLSMSGSLSLTNNWRFNFNPTFDITTRKFTYLSMSVNRSLHCWSMSASIVPFGVYKTYNFHIGVNSSMLADLKYDKQSERSSNTINWY